jgi:hypothetical protein
MRKVAGDMQTELFTVHLAQRPGNAGHNQHHDQSSALSLLRNVEGCLRKLQIGGASYNL